MTHPLLAVCQTNYLDFLTATSVLGQDSGKIVVAVRVTHQVGRSSLPVTILAHVVESRSCRIARQPGQSGSSHPLLKKAIELAPSRTDVNCACSYIHVHRTLHKQNIHWQLSQQHYGLGNTICDIDIG
ncbi:hypothetical protein V2G26_011716 [Clonostachys chloroleuca]